MNTIYRIVWSAATAKWVVASELAKGRKKKSTKSLLSAIALVGLIGGAGVGTAAAQSTTTILGDNAVASCGTPAAGALLNPAWTGASLCGTAIGNSAQGIQGGTAIGDHAVTSGFYGVALGGYSLAGSHATAVGPSAMATGSDSFAGGVNASAVGSSSVAIGNRATANNIANVAIGNGANTTGSNAVSMGYNATANGNFALSLGGGSTASAARATALGTDAVASGANSSALGNEAKAQQANSTAVGNNSSALTNSSVAMGAGAVAGLVDGDGNPLGANQIALGMSTQALGDRSIALGAGAVVDAAATYGMAMGRSANVTAAGVNSVALGQASVADRANTVSVGAAGSERQVVNVAAGVQDTDAVNVSQLKATNDQVAQNTTNITNLDGRVTRNAGDITNLQADVADAVMYDSAAHDSVSLGGAGATAPVALKNIAAGALTGTSTEAVNGSQLFATNQNVTQNATNITNLDGRVTNAETNITNLDGRVTTNEGDIVDIRNQLGDGSIGLVQQDATTRDITVAAGTDGGRVNFAGTDGARKLAGVAAGELSETSTEAVNGSQLFATNENVAQNTTNITNLDGRVTQNEGDIVTIGNRVTTTETNITNLDGRVTTNEGDIVDIRNQLGDGSIGLVQQDATTRDITVAAGTDGGRVDFAGTDGARKLAGVAAGELSETSTEAVNGSQLFATNENVAQNTTNITNLDGRVTQNEGDIVTIGDRVTTTETNITNLDGRVTTNEGDIVDIRNQLGNGSIGLVQQTGANAAVTVAAATGGTIVDFTGTDGTRQLKGVSEGNDGTDAVNVTQLRNEIARASAGDTRYFKADGANDGSDDAINTGSRSVAMGAGSRATADNAVALGAGSVADRANAVSVGSAGNERQIANVADGTEETDAVNVRQLKSAGLVGDDGSLMDAVVYDTGSSRSSITLGGVAGTTITNVMAGLVAPGSMDAINGSQLWGVQDQINKLGDRVTNVENGGGSSPIPVEPINPGNGNPHFASNGDAGKPATATGSSSVAAGEGAAASGNNSTAIGAGSSATGNNSVAIGAGSVADSDNTVSVGSAGNERRITNVAAGTGRTDAANVGQLQDAMSNLQDWTQGQVNGLSKKIDNVQRQANRGIAASAALVNNMPYLPGKVTLNAGVAAYRGQSALGVGVSRWNDSGRFNVNAGVSAAQGDSPIFRVGVGMVLGD